MPTRHYQRIGRPQTCWELCISLEQAPDVLARLGCADEQEILLRQGSGTVTCLQARRATGYYPDLGPGIGEIAREVGTAGVGYGDDSRRLAQRMRHLQALGPVLQPLHRFGKALPGQIVNRHHGALGRGHEQRKVMPR
ncbi:hypothetical protein D3C79_767390 [compost metagenome]